MLEVIVADGLGKVEHSRERSSVTVADGQSLLPWHHATLYHNLESKVHIDNTGSLLIPEP